MATNSCRGWRRYPPARLRERAGAWPGLWSGQHPRPSRPFAHFHGQPASQVARSSRRRLASEGHRRLLSSQYLCFSSLPLSSGIRLTEGVAGSALPAWQAALGGGRLSQPSSSRPGLAAKLHEHDGARPASSAAVGGVATVLYVHGGGGRWPVAQILYILFTQPIRCRGVMCSHQTLC